jgi:hypothetical protein
VGIPPCIKRIAWGDGNANIDDFWQRADEKHGHILLGETPRQDSGDLR